MSSLTNWYNRGQMLQVSVRLPLLATLLLAFNTIVVFAQNTESSKEPFVIESLKTEVVFNTDGTGTEDRFVRVRIQSDVALKEFGILTFPFSSAFERLDIVEVTVKKADGRTVTTPESDVQDRSKQLQVKGLAVADTLQSHVRITRTSARIPNQFWFTYNFFTAGVVLDETLTVHVPRGKYVKVSSPGHDPVLDRDVQHVIYSWKTSHRTAAPDAVFNTSALASVRLATFQNWQELGRWYSPMLNSKVVLAPAIEAKTAELTRGLDSKVEKERAIYEFVTKKFRFVHDSFSEGRIEPHSAEDVLTNGYGDSTDKHTLFAALLKAAGIDAWPALIGNGIYFDPDLPSPDQLNHVITYIPGSDPVWFDTTAELVPFGMLLLPNRDKKALVIPTSGEPAVMTTDAKLPFPADETFEVRSKAGPNGSLSSRIDASMKGDSEVQLKSLYRQMTSQQWPVIAQTTATSWGLTGAVSNVEVQNLTDPEKPLHVSFDYETKDVADLQHPHIRPPLPSIAVLGPPGKTTVHAKIELPQGYAIAIPGNLVSKTNFAEYSSTYTLDGNTVDVTRVLARTVSNVPPDELPAYTKLVSDMREDENRTIDLIRIDTNAPVSNNNQVKVLEISPLPKLEAEEAAFKKFLSERNAETKTKLAVAFEKAFPKSKHLPDVYIDRSRTLISQSDFTAAVNYAEKAISAIVAIWKNSPVSDKEDPQWQQWINGLENSAKSNLAWTKQMLTWQQQQLRQRVAPARPQ